VGAGPATEGESTTMADYDRIRVLWPDHLGLARGKYLPIRYAERGAFHCLRCSRSATTGR
jgi:hypothetical protein